MRTLRLLLLLLLLLVAACNSKPSAPGGSPSGASSPPPSPTPGAPPDPNCGMKTTDWCPASPGDPCGEHKDAASCKAEPRCVGMPYRDESVVACKYDERGFGTNCPTVGCKSPTT